MPFECFEEGIDDVDVARMVALESTPWRLGGANQGGRPPASVLSEIATGQLSSCVSDTSVTGVYWLLDAAYTGRRGAVVGRTVSDAAATIARRVIPVESR